MFGRYRPTTFEQSPQESAVRLSPPPTMLPLHAPMNKRPLSGTAFALPDDQRVSDCGPAPCFAGVSAFICCRAESCQSPPGPKAACQQSAPIPDSVH